MNIIKNLPQKAKTAIAAVLVLCAVAGAAFAVKSNAAQKEDPTIDAIIYTYATETERRLAESVTEYLSRYVILERSASSAPPPLIRHRAGGKQCYSRLRRKKL